MKFNKISDGHFFPMRIGPHIRIYPHIRSYMRKYLLLAQFGAPAWPSLITVVQRESSTYTLCGRVWEDNLRLGRFSSYQISTINKTEWNGQNIEGLCFLLLVFFYIFLQFLVQWVCADNPSKWRSSKNQICPQKTFSSLRSVSWSTVFFSFNNDVCTLYMVYICIGT